MSRDDLKRYWSLADSYTKQCVEVLADRGKPGSPNRDLASSVISDTLRFNPPKYDMGTKLYGALKELTKPDSKDAPAPLSQEQYRYAVESILINNGSQQKSGNLGVLLACADDLKALNNPDSLYTVDFIARLKDTDPALKQRLIDLSAQLKTNVSDRWVDQTHNHSRRGRACSRSKTSA